MTVLRSRPAARRLPAVLVAVCLLVLLSVAGTPPAAASGHGLSAGQSVLSADGRHALVMQTDGNLVLYGPGGPVWHTGTHGHPGAALVRQGDGNVVLYAADGRALWWTGTLTGARNLLAVGDDGRWEVLSPGGIPLWATAPFTLRAGQRRWSLNRSHYLLMQSDGNLVLYAASGRPVWWTSTHGTGATTFAAQPDGNLVLYTSTGRPVWSSLTGGHRGAGLVVQPDGNLVLYSTVGAPVWASSLSRGAPIVPGFAWQVHGVTTEQLGWTWRPGCPVGADQLRQVSLWYIGFDGHARVGRIVTHGTAVPVVVRAFEAMYAARFPIHQIRPIAEFPQHADSAVDHNNTASFICRNATSSTSWSMHAYGLAVDVNPVQNPYLNGDYVYPTAGADYLDRSRPQPGMLIAGDAATRSFAASGWKWGGNWTSTKDWMHFSSNGR